MTATERILQLAERMKQLELEKGEGEGKSEKDGESVWFKMKISDLTKGVNDKRFSAFPVKVYVPK